MHMHLDTNVYTKMCTLMNTCTHMLAHIFIYTNTHIHLFTNSTTHAKKQDIDKELEHM